MEDHFTRHCGRHEVRCKRKYYGYYVVKFNESFSHTFSVATSRRICARQYFDEAYPTLKEQRVFETNLFQKTQRANGKTTKNNAIAQNVFASLYPHLQRLALRNGPW